MSLQERRGPNILVEDPEVIIDITDKTTDYDALVIEAQRQLALMQIDGRDQEDGTLLQRVLSTDRLTTPDKVDEYMGVFDDGEKPAVPVDFMGDADVLIDRMSRTSFFKEAGAVVVVQTIELSRTSSETEANTFQRVELHNLGEE